MWTGSQATSEAPKLFKRSPEANAILEGTDFASEKTAARSDQSNGNNPFFTPPHTPTADSHCREESLDSYDESMTTGKVNHSERAAGAFESAGLKWKPRKFY